MVSRRRTRNAVLVTALAGVPLISGLARASSCNKDVVAPIQMAAGQVCWTYRGAATTFVGSFVDGGLNPRLSGGAPKTGTNFAAEFLAARVRSDRSLSTPQAAGGGGQRPAFTGIYRPAKISRRDRWRCSIASSPTQNIQPSGWQAAG